MLAGRKDFKLLRSKPTWCTLPLEERSLEQALRSIMTRILRRAIAKSHRRQQDLVPGDCMKTMTSSYDLDAIGTSLFELSVDICE